MTSLFDNIIEDEKPLKPEVVHVVTDNFNELLSDDIDTLYNQIQESEERLVEMSKNAKPAVYGNWK